MKRVKHYALMYDSDGEIEERKRREREEERRKKKMMYTQMRGGASQWKQIKTSQYKGTAHLADEQSSSSGRK